MVVACFETSPKNVRQNGGRPVERIMRGRIVSMPGDIKPKDWTGHGCHAAYGSVGPCLFDRLSAWRDLQAPFARLVSGRAREQRKSKEHLAVIAGR